MRKKPWKFEGDIRNFIESDSSIAFYATGISGLTDFNEDETTDREVLKDAKILSHIFEASCRPEKWKQRKRITINNEQREKHH